LSGQSIPVLKDMRGIRIALMLVLLACFAAGKLIPTVVAQNVPNASSAPPAVASHPAIKVDYHNGQLAIDAQNASLVDVLRAVGQKTGASINIPSGAGRERIVEHTGPGPIKSVLEHLLNGSSFNFVIINAPHNSDPKQILLTLQGTASPRVAPETTPQPTESVFYTPPDTADKPVPLSAEMDQSLEAPKETMTPQAMSEFMRQKERELRDKAQQQYPQ